MAKTFCVKFCMAKILWAKPPTKFKPQEGILLKHDRREFFSYKVWCARRSCFVSLRSLQGRFCISFSFSNPLFFLTSSMLTFLIDRTVVSSLADTLIQLPGKEPHCCSHAVVSRVLAYLHSNLRAVAMVRPALLL